MPPITNLPYGEAPAYCFPLFEFAMYLFFIVCLKDAIKRGPQHIAYLAGGLAFGLCLEYIEVVSGMGYTYGRFLIMFGKAPLDIPLCIGVGWSIIMYASRRFSDGLKLIWWAAAALDALLAINIDLSMDTVAYRLHMWHWNWEGTGLHPLTAQWFGVPWGNFFGWLIVIFFYSYFSRLFEQLIAEKRRRLRLITIPLLALLCAEVVLYGTEVYIDDWLYNRFGIGSLYRLLAFLGILFILIIVGWRRKKAGEFLPLITWLVPVYFHLFFFAWLFLGGFYTENKWMVLAACLNLIPGFAVHAASPGRNAARHFATSW